MLMVVAHLLACSGAADEAPVAVPGPAPDYPVMTHGPGDLTLEELEAFLRDPRLPEALGKEVDWAQMGSMCEAKTKDQRKREVDAVLRRVQRQSRQVWTRFEIGTEEERIYRFGKYADKRGEQGLCFDDEPFGEDLTAAFRSLYGR